MDITLQIMKIMLNSKPPDDKAEIIRLTNIELERQKNNIKRIHDKISILKGGKRRMSKIRTKKNKKLR